MVPCPFLPNLATCFLLPFNEIKAPEDHSLGGLKCSLQALSDDVWVRSGGGYGAELCTLAISLYEVQGGLQHIVKGNGQCR